MLISSPRSWPLRARLTASFAVVMAIVLVLGGGFVYVQMRQSLQDTTTLGLRSRAQDLRDARSSASPSLPQGTSSLTERGESIAQLIGASGAVVDATPGLRDRSLLNARDLRRALAGEEVLLERRSTPAGDDRVRLLAVGMPNKPEVLVVGESVEQSQDALVDLTELLLLGGPFVLLLSSLAGYLLAGAALRPVEAMRARAQSISASEPGARLPVSDAGDEIQRLGSTFNDLLARLEAAAEAERTFVSDASHELRTPLAILKAELEYALRPARTDGERTEALEAAAVETDRLVRLAEDLLVIARAQGGKLAIRHADIDVADLLRTVCARFERAAGDAGVALHLVDAAPGAVLRGDRSRLEQALGNLIDNALGHGAGTVTVTVAVEGDRLALQVVDDGDGFPPDFVPQAFDRFSRADKARQRGGSGLGLSIVEAIARAHGGAVTAANRTPAGAELTLTLPLGEVPAPSRGPGGDAHARADR